MIRITFPTTTPHRLGERRLAYELAKALSQIGFRNVDIFGGPRFISGYIGNGSGTARIEILPDEVKAPPPPVFHWLGCDGEPS
jgi:hypothetical protein